MLNNDSQSTDNETQALARKTRWAPPRQCNASRQKDPFTNYLQLSHAAKANPAAYLEKQKTNTVATALEWVVIGELYHAGIGTQLNEEDAFECFRNAIEKDKECYPAWMWLGHCHREGLGTPINIKAAIDCYDKTTSLNPKKYLGWAWLGYCYKHFFKTERSRKRAFENMSKAAELAKDSAPLLNELGCYYAEDRENELSKKEAFNHFLKATKVNKDYPTAWKNLAECYLKGQGTKRDEKKAFQCYNKVTELDAKDIDAWKVLARCYKKGIGASIDLNEERKCRKMVRKLAQEKAEKNPAPSLCPSICSSSSEYSEDEPSAENDVFMTKNPVLESPAEVSLLVITPLDNDFQESMAKDTLSSLPLQENEAIEGSPDKQEVVLGNTAVEPLAQATMEMDEVLSLQTLIDAALDPHVPAVLYTSSTREEKLQEEMAALKEEVLSLKARVALLDQRSELRPK